LACGVVIKIRKLLEMREFDILHATTVHPRTDVRIEIKELYPANATGK